MGYLELGEINRSKYPDVPERVPFVLHQFGMRSTKALRERTGLDYETMVRLFEGVAKLDKETGEPIYERDEHGEIVKDEAGEPKLELFRDEDAIAALMWLILWDNGYRLDWTSFNPVFNGVRLRLVDDDESVDEGKAPQPEEPAESPTTTDQPS